MNIVPRSRRGRHEARRGQFRDHLRGIGFHRRWQNALKEAEIVPKTAEISQLPKTTVDVDEETGKKIVKLMETLDDHDDVQNVYTNANLNEKMMSE